MGASCPAIRHPPGRDTRSADGEGDTLVIETAGFNKRTITITDPQTFTKPITFSVVEELLPDTDHLEHYCAENEGDDAQHAGRRTETMIRGKNSDMNELAAGPKGEPRRLKRGCSR